MSKSKRKAFNEVGIVALRNLFDRHVTNVLGGEYIELQDRKRGERRKYRIVKPLPSKEEYLKLVDKKYTITLYNLLQDAICEIEGLKDEIQDWYDNLPEAFQNGDKGEQLQECISQFDSATIPCLPDESNETEWKKLQETCVFIPSQEKSRAGRLNEALRKLEFVGEVVSDVDELSHLRDEIESIVSDCGEIEFPGMY